jgi:hypothetical protein
MADLINGARDRGPLEGWVIALWMGTRVLGRPTEDKTVPFGQPKIGAVIDLSPAYDVQLATQVGPQGIGLARACFPLWSFPSVRRIEYAVVALRVDDLSRTERQALEKAVLQCDELLRHMRAADAGVAIPRPDAARKLKLG